MKDFAGELIKDYWVKVTKTIPDVTTSLCGQPLEADGRSFIIPAHRAKEISEILPHYSQSEPFLTKDKELYRQKICSSEEQSVPEQLKPETIFGCFCGFETKDRSVLSQHMLSHVEKKPRKTYARRTFRKKTWTKTESENPIEAGADKIPEEVMA